MQGYGQPGPFRLVGTAFAAVKMSPGEQYGLPEAVYSERPAGMLPPTSGSPCPVPTRATLPGF
jgi:hypothetical protein